MQGDSQGVPGTAFQLCCSVLFHVARRISKGELLMTLVPFADWCLWLGIDPKTFRLWLKAANLSCCLHPTDARLKCLTPSNSSTWLTCMDAACLIHYLERAKTQLKTPLSSLMAQCPSVPQADAAALASRPPVAVPSEVVAERAPAHRILG
jgi:hypothetical protein